LAWAGSVVGLHVIVGNVFAWYGYMLLPAAALAVGYASSHWRAVCGAGLVIGLSLGMVPAVTSYPGLVADDDSKRAFEAAMTDDRVRDAEVVYVVNMPAPPFRSGGAFEGRVTGTGYLSKSLRASVADGTTSSKSVVLSAVTRPYQNSLNTSVVQSGEGITVSTTADGRIRWLGRPPAVADGVALHIRYNGEEVMRGRVQRGAVVLVFRYTPVPAVSVVPVHACCAGSDDS